MNKKQRHALIQKATDTHLSPTEQAELEAYQQSDEGQIVTAVHDKLTSDLDLDGPDMTMNRQRVHRVAAQIDAKVQQKQRRLRFVQTTRTFALATAVFLFAFLGINWLIAPPYVPEMAAGATVAPTRVIPTDTPIPTASLKSGMRYVDLTQENPSPVTWIDDDFFTEDILTVQEKAGYPLQLPTQLGNNFVFVGAMYNPKVGSVELAFVTDTKIRGDYPLWILSQKPFAASVEENSVLSLLIDPMPGQDYEIKNRESSTLEVYGTTGLFEGMELFVDFTEWTAVNQLWWQKDGQQFSLTMIAPANINGRTLAGMAQNFELRSMTTD